MQPTHKLKRKVEDMKKGTEVVLSESRNSYSAVVLPVVNGETQPLQANWVDFDDMEEIDR